MARRREMTSENTAGNISRGGKVAFLIDAERQMARRLARNADPEERRKACLQNATFQGSKAKVTLPRVSFQEID